MLRSKCCQPWHTWVDCQGWSWLSWSSLTVTDHTWQTTHNEIFHWEKPSRKMLENKFTHCKLWYSCLFLKNNKIFTHLIHIFSEPDISTPVPGGLSGECQFRALTALTLTRPPDNRAVSGQHYYRAQAAFFTIDTQLRHENMFIF